MADYRFVQARYIYGPRKATLGIMLHGSESESGLLGYLQRDPARGVSANFVCLYDTGEMVQMVPWDRSSGSLNPADRSTNKAYYGHDHLVDVLGDLWTDPNAAVLSVEIEMFARKGPNPKQVQSLVAWAKDMKARYPTLRGALGHADQTDTKGCPGATPAMRSVFDAIGGHGLWSDMPGLPITLANPPVVGSLVIPQGTDSIDLETRAHYTVPINVSRPAVTASLRDIATEDGYLVDLDGDKTHFIRKSQPVTFTPNAGAPAPVTLTYSLLIDGKPVSTGSVTRP